MTHTIHDHDLTSMDPDVRLTQFDRLCRREKTTEVATDEEINLIRQFVYFNMNVSDQGFRQKFLTCIKYFLIQLKESGYAIFNSLSRPDEIETDLETCQAILRRYQESTKWLIEYCFYCLRLHGNYARRASALHILDLVYCSPILKDKLRNGYVKTWNLNGIWTADNMRTLTSCLGDPYESNQVLALAILKTLDDGYSSFLDWLKFLQNAFDWCSRSKTQYPEIAVYYFLLVVHKADLSQLLTETNRNAAATDISPLTGSTCKGSVADADFLMSTSSWSMQNRNCLILARRLMVILQERTNAAEEDLVRASVEGPPWGLLKSLLFVLKEVDWTEMLKNPEGRSHWCPLISALLATCHRLTTVVAPIVNSISPEGYLPMDMIRIDSNFIVDDQDQNGDVDEVKFERWHHATCQAVLVCSWRTQKEVSALFGFLVSLQHPQPLLDFQELCTIGDYFMVQLTECKHRGAFECAYAAFVDACSAAWRSPLESTRELPRTWLRKIVDGVVAISKGQGDGYDVKYCVTRRSAGVPFLIQAVLATEPKAKDGEGSSLLYETLQKLLRILFEEETGNAEDRAIAKVHSLNILRALVRESKLGVACLTPSWLSLIAQADLLAFTHRSWAVRNSATLLFSAWMVRMFGVPRKRNEISAKNRMSATDFDASCPDLFSFLLEHLRLYHDQSTKHSTFPFQEMMLFPILSILARLYPSSSSNSVLRLFVPYVLNIMLTCPVITVRHSAATALNSVLDLDSVEDLLKKFSSAVEYGQCPQNALHGMLLWMEQMSREDGYSVPDFKTADFFTKLAPFNSSSILRIIANRACLESNVITSNVAQLLSSLDEREREFGDTSFGPIVALLLRWALDGEDNLLDQLRACCDKHPRFRCAFYKEWRSIFKKSSAQDSRRQRLIDLANGCIDPGLLWRDVVGHNGDFKLCLQAIKFRLTLPSSSIVPGNRETMIQELLRLFEICSQARLRRRYFELACHIFNADSTNTSNNLATRILGELDASSRPFRSLDDRLMAVDCLNILDPKVLQENSCRLLVVLIRLLTDLEDVIRDEAASLFSRRFNYVSATVHSAVAVFICVGKLLGMENGKRTLCDYLLEMAEELEKTSEENATEERVFDKNEANYNMEPLLIAEWLRIPPGMTDSQFSISNVMLLVDQCLITNGPKHVEDPAKSNDKGCMVSRILRNAVEGV